MRSLGIGTSTSKVEVLNISQNGIWLYVRGREYFLSYQDYPWFKEVRLSQIHRVQLFHGRHLRWDDLDVDLDLDSLEHLDRYPLKYQ